MSLNVFWRSRWLECQSTGSQSFICEAKSIDHRAGETVLGEIFGDLYGGEKDSVLSLDTSMCSYENLKVLSLSISSLIAQMKTVFEDKIDFLDGFINKMHAWTVWTRSFRQQTCEITNGLTERIVIKLMSHVLGSFEQYINSFWRNCLVYVTNIRVS